MKNEKRIQKIERDIFKIMNHFFITGQIDYEKTGELTMEKCKLKRGTPPNPPDDG